MKTKSCGIKAGRRMNAYAGAPSRASGRKAKAVAVSKYLRAKKK